MDILDVFADTRQTLSSHILGKVWISTAEDMGSDFYMT